MKKIILFLSLFLFVRCHKEAVPLSLYFKYVYGEVSGIKLNGIAWPTEYKYKILSNENFF